MSCREDLPLVLERWRRFSRSLDAADRAAMDVIIAALERNGPATFANLDDPLEAALLAVLIELEKAAEGAPVCWPGVTCEPRSDAGEWWCGAPEPEGHVRPTGDGLSAGERLEEAGGA